MRAFSSFYIVNYDEEEILEIYSISSDSETFQPLFIEFASVMPKSNISITISFIPYYIGESNENIILLTNFGTFLYSVKGYGIENHYQLSPLIKDKVIQISVCSKVICLTLF